MDNLDSLTSFSRLEAIRENSKTLLLLATFPYPNPAQWSLSLPNTPCSTRHCRCPSSGVCPYGDAIGDAIGVYGDPDSRTPPTCLFLKYPASNSPKNVKIAPNATPPTAPPAIAPAFGPDPAVTSAVTTVVAVTVVAPCLTGVAGPFRPVSRTSPSRTVVSPADVRRTVSKRERGSPVQ